MYCGHFAGQSNKKMTPMASHNTITRCLRHNLAIPAPASSAINVSNFTTKMPDGQRIGTNSQYSGFQNGVSASRAAIPAAKGP